MQGLVSHPSGFRALVRRFGSGVSASQGKITICLSVQGMDLPGRSFGRLK